MFSYWTNTLDLVQLMLNDCGIPYTRIDGNTSLRRRKEAMRDFQHNGSVRVILVSITCGGAGYVWPQENHELIADQTPDSILQQAPGLISLNLIGTL